MPHSFSQIDCSHCDVRLRDRMNPDLRRAILQEGTSA
jgi:hypothetical protein